MKFVKYMFCLTIALPLCGSGTPADIRLGELQTLQKRIASGAIKQTEAQTAFQQLTSKLTPQDKIVHKKAITEVVQTAQKQGITLPTDDIHIPTQTLQLPPLMQSYSEQATTKSPEKIVSPQTTIPQVPKQKPTIIAPKGGKLPQIQPEPPLITQPKPEMITEPKKQPQDIIVPLENKPPQAAVEKPKEAPQAQEVIKRTLTPEQLQKIGLALKTLIKTYKTESLDVLEQSLAKINAVIGAAQIPESIETVIAKLEHFKKKLADDLAFITTLGKEIADKELPDLKNKLSDPKALKDAIARVGAIEHDIKDYLTIYKNNTNVEIVVNNALKNLTQSFYAMLQQSMASASQVQDAAAVRKLVRVYAHGVEQFPVYSQKSLEKQALAEQLKKNRENLNKLTKNNFYTTLDPLALESQLALLEEYAYLLDDHELEQLKTIRNYLDVTFDHQQWLKDIDKELEKTNKFIANKPKDSVAIDEKISMLLAAEDELNNIAKTQKELGGTWLNAQVQARLTQVNALIAELEKFLNAAEELEKMAAYSIEFESQQLGPAITNVRFPQSLAPRAITLEPLSDSVAKVRTESEQRDKELAQQQLKAHDNQ